MFHPSRFALLSFMMLSFVLGGCSASTEWLDQVENAVAQQSNAHINSSVELSTGPTSQTFTLDQSKKGDGLSKIQMTDAEGVEWLQIHQDKNLWTYESRNNTFTQNLNPDFPGPSDDFSFWFASLRPALKSMKMEESPSEKILEHETKLITLTRKSTASDQWAIYKKVDLWVDAKTSWPLKIKATLDNGTWTWTTTSLNLEQSPDDAEFVWEAPKNAMEIPFGSFRLKPRQESLPNMDLATDVIHFSIQKPSFIPSGYEAGLIGIANPLPKGVAGPQLLSMSYEKGSDDMPIWLHQSNSTFFNDLLQAPLSSGPEKIIVTTEPSQLLLRWTRADHIMMGLFSNWKDEDALTKMAESLQ